MLDKFPQQKTWQGKGPTHYINQAQPITTSAGFPEVAYDHPEKGMLHLRMTIKKNLVMSDVSGWGIILLEVTPRAKETFKKKHRQARRTATLNQVWDAWFNEESLHGMPHNPIVCVYPDRWELDSDLVPQIDDILTSRPADALDHYGAGPDFLSNEDEAHLRKIFLGEIS